MDPRPYHFEYRRPRMSNPTYESLKLYESIYHLDKFKKANPENKTPLLTSRQANQPVQKMHRHQSTDIRQPHLLSNRYGKVDSKEKQSQKLNSSMSQYANHLMKAQLLDQNRVFEKQEKQYNIISYNPKGYKPQLKNFPRLTLEHQLIERNSSPSSPHPPPSSQ